VLINPVWHYITYTDCAEVPLRNCSLTQITVRHKQPTATLREWWGATDDDMIGSTAGAVVGDDVRMADDDWCPRVQVLHGTVEPIVHPHGLECQASRDGAVCSPVRAW